MTDIDAKIFPAEQTTALLRILDERRTLPPRISKPPPGLGVGQQRQSAFPDALEPGTRQHRFHHTVATHEVMKQRGGSVHCDHEQHNISDEFVCRYGGLG